MNGSWRNILACYDRAPSHVKADGVNWYANALGIAQAISRKHDLPLATAAGVIAALSPQAAWDRNVSDAWTLAGGSEPRVKPDSLAKAQRIIDGEHPLDVLRGNKVRAFYAAIMGDHSVVVVDRHAASCYANRKLSDAQVRPVFATSGKLYRRIASAYKRAAKVAGVAPCAMQAVAWVQWRQARSNYVMDLEV